MCSWLVWMLLNWLDTIRQQRAHCSLFLKASIQTSSTSRRLPVGPAPSRQNLVCVDSEVHLSLKQLSEGGLIVS